MLAFEVIRLNEREKRHRFLEREEDLFDCGTSQSQRKMAGGDCMFQSRNHEERDPGAGTQNSEMTLIQILKKLMD